MGSRESDFDSIMSWRQWYFIGISKNDPDTITLTSEQLEALFAVTNAKSVLVSGSPIDPRLIINHKGTTVWILLFVLSLMKDKPALEAVSKGRSSLFIPPESIREVFGDHINWPESILKKHPIGLRRGHIFVLPFLTHRDSPAPVPLSRSITTPDGSIELIQFKEFNDQDPEEMMRSLSEICTAINGSVGP